MNSLNDADAIAESFCRERDFRNNGRIGSGSYKSVFYVVSNRGAEFALKIMDTPNPRIDRELEAIRRCDHRNIAKVYDAGLSRFRDSDYFYYLEEYLAGGSIGSYLANHGLLGFDETQSLGGQLLDALSHIAQLGLVHRDIKPDNILLRDTLDNPVLVDFGVVRDLTASSLTATWLSQGPGTPYYAAPEQLNNQKQMIDWRTDQYSLGVLLCIAIYGQHPYQYPDEPIYCTQTVERVAARGPRHDGLLHKMEADGLFCMVTMTAPWPIQRYRKPSQLLSEWLGQRSF